MATADDPKPDPPPPSDVALIGGPTEHGGVHIVRLREGQVEVGELRAAPEGKPILGESVRLHARADHPRLFDVEVMARGPLAVKQQREKAEAAALKGPAKVATEAYRTGWESIFGFTGARGGSLPS